MSIGLVGAIMFSAPRPTSAASTSSRAVREAIPLAVLPAKLPRVAEVCTAAVAFIVEQGGLLSHAAVTAPFVKRPMIVLESATSRLPAGPSAEVNGDTGAVTSSTSIRTSCDSRFRLTWRAGHPLHPLKNVNLYAEGGFRPSSASVGVLAMPPMNSRFCCRRRAAASSYRNGSKT